MLPLWLGAGLGLGLGLRWRGLGFALRFGAALNWVLGLYFGFGSGFAPCAIALDVLFCKRETRD